ncbi:hypothetical protein J2X01_002456 [Arthrobacter ginsengisoli]|uniref:Transposase DDE domain-containing protein n=1 Tax=Arthrobacter ginsengisoli TaxID=1356565 RepID=A0ABU1UD78_9MICC|nr:hypothetical protein [Arthrobacter ginsengisoli]
MVSGVINTSGRLFGANWTCDRTILLKKRSIQQMQVFHNPAAVSAFLRRGESCVLGRAVAGDDVGPGPRAARTGRRTAHGADGQGRECRAKARIPGGRDGRWRGLDRRHVHVAPQGSEAALHSLLRAIDAGLVPAVLHVRACRQLDAVASRFLGNLAGRAPLLGAPSASDFVFVDVDDTIIEVHGYAKQGSGYGYAGVRGLKAPPNRNNAYHAARRRRQPTGADSPQRLLGRSGHRGRCPIGAEPGSAGQRSHNLGPS